MKSKIFNFLFLSFSLILYNSTNIVAQTSDSWFTVKKLAEKTWVINDHGAVNIYLIEGNEKVLVIDTGIGVADLFSTIRHLTKKPLVVVNTHNHMDHAGANYQFDEIYLHPKDINLTSPHKEKGNRILSQMTKGAHPCESELYKDKPKNPRIIPVNEGFIFDLGDRKIEVIETPGHTPGSICLLDIEQKVLYTGDTNNTVVWLFLKECTPLSIYYDTFKKQLRRIAEFDTLMPGHGEPVTSAFIKDQVECVKRILDGTCETNLFESFGGNATLCKYESAQVAFDPKNLFRKN